MDELKAQINLDIKESENTLKSWVNEYKDRKNEQFSGKGRTGSRQLLLQIIYQRLMNEDNIGTLIKQSRDRKEYTRIDQNILKSY